MIAENTDLERRVLAQQQVLQVLIAHMSEAEPKLLEHLQTVFKERPRGSASKQDYTDTVGYAHEIIDEVVRLHAKAAARQ